MREGTIFLTHLPSLSKGGLKRLPLAIFCGNWGRMKSDPSSLHCRVSHSSPSFLIFSSQPLPGQHIRQCPVPAVVIESSRYITMGEEWGSSKLSEHSCCWSPAAAAPQCMRQRASRSQLTKPHKQVRQVRARQS